MRLPGKSLLLAVLVPASLGCALLVRLAGGARSQGPVPRARLPAAAESVREGELRAIREPVDRGARAGAEPASRAPDSTVHGERAIAELAGLLGAEPFDAACFDTAVRALAHELGQPLREELQVALADPARAPLEHVVAAELLRALPDAGGAFAPPLPIAALVAMRSVARAPQASPAADAAARSLAALGTRADAGLLIDDLLQGSGVLRERAARALADVRDPALALELTGALDARTDASTLELALTALARMAARTRSAGHELEHSMIRADLLRLVQRDSLEPGLRRRTLAALALLAPDDFPTEELVLGASPDEVRLLVSSSPARPGAIRAGPLVDTLLDPARPPGQRAAAAEVLARSPASIDPGARAVAVDVLCERLQDAGSAEARRRALYALGSFAAPETADLFRHTARFDPEPAVRSAGLRALRGFDAALRDEVLVTAARSDPSPAVRTLALHELSELPPGSAPILSPEREELSR